MKNQSVSGGQMGREQRAREAEAAMRRKRRWSILKGVVATILFLPLAPFLFGHHCYKENAWPWEQ